MKGITHASNPPNPFYMPNPCSTDYKAPAYHSTGQPETAFTAEFRRLILIGYSSALFRARKRLKGTGLRMSYLWGIELLGSNPEGLTLAQAHKSAEVGRTAVLLRLKVLVNRGFAVRTGYVYTLSETGWIAFHTIREEFKHDLDKAMELITSEVRSRLNG